MTPDKGHRQGMEVRSIIDARRADEAGPLEVTDKHIREVVINDSPAFRTDDMPHGGDRQSGPGRSGIYLAAEEMSDIQILAAQMRR